MKPIRRHILLLLTLVLLAACGGAGRRQTLPTEEFATDLYQPAYAGGFTICGAEGRQGALLRMKNPWQGAQGVETGLLILRGGDTLPDGYTGQVLRGEARRIVCMSSTHIAMLDAIGAVDRVVGASGIAYISNPAIAARRDSIGEVGYEGNIDYETLAALEPDIVLLFGINGASAMEGKLRELGIPFAYVGDYLEESPLGKAEWMVAVGEIAGRRSEAEAHFAAIPRRYEALRRRVAGAAGRAPKVMVNSPYGDAWFMPPMTSYVAQTIADAGGDYLYAKNTTTRSLPVDLEEAALLTAQADVWINVGDFPTLDALRARLPKLADAPCVRRGDVWNCDLRTNPAGGNDYWEWGVVRPDLVLRDLARIFHPELFGDGNSADAEEDAGADFVFYRKLR